MCPLYVSTTCFSDGNADLAESLSALSGLEIDGVELVSTHVWRDDIERIISSASLGGIFTHNYFPPARNELVLDIASDDDSVRNSSIAHARYCIDVAARIGATLYTIHPGFAAPASLDVARWSQRQFDFEYMTPSTEGGREIRTARMTAALKDLAELARQRGILLAVESQGSITTPGVSLLETIDDFEQLFRQIPEGLKINFNLAHTIFAAQLNGFKVADFIEQFQHLFAAVEISHNDGHGDQHRPLVTGSFALDWIEQLHQVPLILEFRNATRNEIITSIGLARQAINAAA
jgi:sugar phosphate isomerase/epimerase